MNIYELKLYYSSTEPPTGALDVDGIASYTIYLKRINPYTAIEIENYKTPSEEFGEYGIEYNTYNIEFRDFKFAVDPADDWDYSTYLALIGIIKNNKYLYLVSDITPTNGKVYPIVWDADLNPLRIIKKQVTTEEIDNGYLNMKITASSLTYSNLYE